jgi:hypothetical protein
MLCFKRLRPPFTHTLSRCAVCSLHSSVTCQVEICLVQSFYGLKHPQRWVLTILLHMHPLPKGTPCQIMRHLCMGHSTVGPPTVVYRAHCPTTLAFEVVLVLILHPCLACCRPVAPKPPVVGQACCDCDMLCCVVLCYSI